MECVSEPLQPRSKPQQDNSKHLERLLGLRQDGMILPDAIFVSLDLEATSARQKLHPLSTKEELSISQVGLASLDTRDINSLSDSSDLRSLISVKLYHVKYKPKSKRAARKKRVRAECAFAPAQTVRQDQVHKAILQELYVRDDGSSQGHSKKENIRAIVLVGHSIGGDLRLLRYRGLDLLSSCAQIKMLIDTHSLSRLVLPAHRPNLPPAPGQSFSLAGVLGQLGYSLPMALFHNAGNDAAYSLYAMLLLAVRQGTAPKLELSASELTNLETIRRGVSKALKHDLLPRPRRSDPQLPNSGVRATLGAGLLAIASSIVNPYLGGLNLSRRSES